MLEWGLGENSGALVSTRGVTAQPLAEAGNADAIRDPGRFAARGRA